MCRPTVCVLNSTTLQTPLFLPLAFHLHTRLYLFSPFFSATSPHSPAVHYTHTTYISRTPARYRIRLYPLVFLVSFFCSLRHGPRPRVWQSAQCACRYSLTIHALMIPRAHASALETPLSSSSPAQQRHQDQLSLSRLSQVRTCCACACACVCKANASPSGFDSDCTDSDGQS